MTYYVAPVPPVVPVVSVVVEKVYFLFIALKRMAAVASLRSATVGSERRWCQTYGLGVKNSFL